MALLVRHVDYSTLVCPTGSDIFVRCVCVVFVMPKNTCASLAYRLLKFPESLGIGIFVICVCCVMQKNACFQVKLFPRSN